MMKCIIYCLFFILLAENLSGKETGGVKLLANDVERLLKSEIATNADSAAKAEIYVQLGNLLSSRYCYSGSLEYYSKAFAAYMQTGDIKGACGSLTAQAKCEFMMAKYDDAMNNYQKALSMAGSIKDTNSTIKILNCLSAVVFYSSNHTISKNDLMEKGMEASGIEVERLTALCANAAAIDKEFGKEDGEQLYLASDEKIKDSLNKAGEEFLDDFNSVKARLAQTIMLNKKMKERESCIIGCFIMFLLLLAVSGIYMYNGIKKRHNELLRQTLKAGEQVSTFSSILERKIMGFKRFLDASSYKRERPEEFLAAFKRYINIENGRLPDAFGDIIEIANLYHNGVVDRLRSDYPSLNEEELYMCALIALDFPMSSIKFIYNHASEDSMYNKRSRLKKKLGLAPDERPEKFIKLMLLQPLQGASC